MKYLYITLLLLTFSCATQQDKEHSIIEQSVKDGKVIYKTIQVVKYKECQSPLFDNDKSNDKTSTIIKQAEPEIIYLKKPSNTVKVGILSCIGGILAGSAGSVVAFSFGFKFGLFGFFKWLAMLAYRLVKSKVKGKEPVKINIDVKNK